MSSKEVLTKNSYVRSLEGDNYADLVRNKRILELNGYKVRRVYDYWVLTIKYGDTSSIDVRIWFKCYSCDKYNDYSYMDYFPTFDDVKQCCLYCKKESAYKYHS